MTGVDRREKTFTAGDYVPAFAADVAAAVAAQPPQSILDIGCGNGSLLLELAARVPAARLTGIDVSEHNIAAARNCVAERGLASRVELVVADYIGYRLPVFDLIVSYSTLHLIDAPIAMLIDKLSNELARGGSLIATVPARHRYNDALMLVRRGVRRVRSPALDGVILRLAQLSTRGRLSRQQLAERVDYMYVLPHFFWGCDMIRLFASRGIATLSERPEPHASLAQPRHVRVHLSKEPA